MGRSFESQLQAISYNSRLNQCLNTYFVIGEHFVRAKIMS